MYIAIQFIYMPNQYKFIIKRHLFIFSIMIYLKDVRDLKVNVRNSYLTLTTKFELYIYYIAYSMTLHTLLQQL